MTNTNLHILVVDDNAADIEFLRFAFEEARAEVELISAAGGLAALARLNQDPLPDLMVVDLNMPGITGFDVLVARNRDDRLRQIPAVVLTTSSAPSDQEACRRLGACDVLTKPSRFDELVAMVPRLLAPAHAHEARADAAGSA